MTRRHVLAESGIEYVSHACNYVEGCAHGCRYCYARDIKRVSYAEWRQPREVAFAVALLENDLGRLKKPPDSILLSSSHDPYQSASLPTREVLETLAGRGLAAWVLTKGCHRVKGGFLPVRDFDLLQGPGCRFGVTLTTHDEDVRWRWEPYASSIRQRILTLVNAKLRGVSTWVSVEPVLPGLDVPRLARELQGLADWVVIGKWNYSRQAEAMDWPRIRAEAEEAFTLAGIPYLVKSELREASAAKRAA